MRMRRSHPITRRQMNAPPRMHPKPRDLQVAALQTKVTSLPITHYSFFCCLQLTSFIFVIFDAANPSFFSSIYGIQSAGNIHTGPIAYSRRSVRSTSEAQNKEGDDAAKKIAEAEAEKNKMEETRKLKQQRAKEAIKNKRAKAQLAKDNQALRDEHEKS